MLEQLELIINDEKGRLDKVLADTYSDYSRSQIQQWLKAGYVTVNDMPVAARYKVATGDKIVISRPSPEKLTVEPENIPLDIVYEDDDLLVVNKPQGMVVHPSKGHASGTLVNALLYHSQDIASINDVVRPGIVHRIDKDTSGLLMVAKNDVTLRGLQQQLQAHTVKREYIALAHGVIVHERGKIDAPIGRDPHNRVTQTVIESGKPAVTHFQVMERYQDYTLCRCRLETGRTHQIRVHMAYIEHPIAGDPVYGPNVTLEGAGQYLHAATLGFTHPRTNETLYFEAPLPTYFESALKNLAK